MKVYLKSGRANHTMFVTPASDDAMNSDWLNPDGTHRQFTVRFVDGCAEVPSGLGRWLLDKGHARKTAATLIMPSAHLVVPELRERRHRVLA